jgi:hypothetical protein
MKFSAFRVWGFQYLKYGWNIGLFFQNELLYYGGRPAGGDKWNKGFGIQEDAF